MEISLSSSELQVHNLHTENNSSTDGPRNTVFQLHDCTNVTRLQQKPDCRFGSCPWLEIHNVMLSGNAGQQP